MEVDDSNKKIIDINNSMVLSSCGKDYLTKNEIAAVINKYLGYHLCVLGVDGEGNVYMNPFEQASPVLLRKVTYAKNEVQFELYKGNWYIKKQ